MPHFDEAGALEPAGASPRLDDEARRAPREPARMLDGGRFEVAGRAGAAALGRGGEADPGD